MNTYQEPNKKEDSSKLLTLIQASELLSLKVSRLRYEVFHKRVPHLKIGRSIRFSKSDLLLWLEKQKKNKEVLND